MTEGKWSRRQELFIQFAASLILCATMALLLTWVIPGLSFKRAFAAWFVGDYVGRFLYRLIHGEKVS